jgi:hypothetical protein
MVPVVIKSSSPATDIAALGVAVAGSVDNLISKAEVASQPLVTLYCQLHAFVYALKELHDVEQQSTDSISHIGQFSRQHGNAAIGGYIVIKVLEQDLKADVYTALHDNETEETERVRSTQAELMNKWNDAYVKKWSDMLSRHTTVLLLLLERYILLRIEIVQTDHFHSHQQLEQNGNSNGNARHTSSTMDLADIDEKVAALEPSHFSKSGKIESPSDSFQPNVADQFDNEDSISIESTDPNTGWETLRSRAGEECHQLFPDDAKDVIAKCQSLRIVVLGRAGVGKSALSLRVVGLPCKVLHRARPGIPKKF